MKIKIKYVAISLTLVFLLVGFSGSRAETDSPFEDRILEMAAVELGFVPDAVQLGGIQRIELPLTNTKVYQIKLIDKETGEIYSTVIDEEGYFQDLENARRTELDAQDALYGRLHPALHDRLETMADGDWVMVGIWLKADEPPPSNRADIEPGPAAIETGDAEPGPPRLRSARPPESLPEKTKRDIEEALSERVWTIRDQQLDQRAAADAARQERAADLAIEMAAVQASLMTDLEAQGFTVDYASPLAPLIYVELPKSAILALAQRVDIDAIYGPTQSADLMNTAKPTQKADVVDAWGFDGTDIDVAILEDSRVEFNNPWLNAGTTRVPGDTNVDDHATATAGMVASQHATYQGIAQGVDLFSANATTYGDANLSAAMDWAAITQNVDIINNSWGDPAGTGLNQHDRHLDYIVRNLWSTVTVAAGNETDGCGTGTGKVTSPARGYNMISVGNYADQNTLTWDDDAMDACSSWVNPSTNIEKPEVAASGSSITSTTMSSPWIANVGSGTSYAAPMVAGAAALLMDRNSSLEVRPEAVKAILMATAGHNIEGNSRLSSLDGAGGVDMRAAFHVVDEGWWAWNSRTSTDFPYSFNYYAHEGEVVRAAIAWDSNPNSSYTTDPLQADIDLSVYQGSTYITGSASFSNSYEVVEFTAPSTGSYEFRISAFSFTGTTEYVGFAFWMPHRSLVAYVPQTWGTPPVSGHYYRFNRSSYWNAVAVRPPAGADYDLYLYANSAFNDPDDYDSLRTSTYGGSSVDFVLIDGNHAPAGNYYAEVREYSGTGGNYAIEWGAWTSDTADLAGTYGPYTMTPSQVIRVWDSWLAAGTRKYFAVKPVSGNADLAMGLYDSDPATSSTWYRYRGNYLVYSDFAGAGGSEFMNHQTSTSDYMGLVVWNDAATTATSFYLYTDTTAPTGSIAINGGATYTSSTNVTLNLSGSDAETGVAEMRFLNAGGTYSAWEPFNTTKSWNLPPGDGTKIVYVEYRNNAGMMSSSYADAIILDTAAPTPNPMIWATEPNEINTSQISMAATSASDPSLPINYYFNFYYSPTGGGGGSNSGWQSSVFYTDSGLGANHQYGYRVNARDAAGNLTLYSGVSYDYTDIETPSGITFGTITTNSIQARSTNTPSGLTRGNSGLYIQNFTTGAVSGWKQNNSYWTSGGLSPNTQYGFRAIARNGDADTTNWSSTSSRYTLANAPAAAAFSNITQTSIRANWTANGNPGGTQYYCENMTAATNSGWTTATTWNSTGLTPANAYSFRVRARNASGAETGWISLGTQSTLPSVPPCEGDFNGDGDVDIDDLAIFAAAFGSILGDSNYNPAADFNGDNDVDGTDLWILLSDFGRIDCP